MKAIFYTGFLFFVLSHVDSMQLRCYDCDPTEDKENCWDPTASSARATTCDMSKGEVACSTAFYHYTGDLAHKTGVYRGCVKVEPDVEDYCDILKESEINATITHCHFCSESNCNNKKISNDGSKNMGSFLHIVIVPIVMGITMHILY